MGFSGAGILGVVGAAVAVLGLLLGLPILILGMRGHRTDDHPLCRRCRFDLVGARGTVLCPECGGDVAAPGSVRIGNRRRRRGMIVLGTMLLLVGIGAGGALGWSAAARFDWNTVKPYWLLMHDAESTDLKSMSGAGGELLSRLQRDALRPGQAERAVALALDLQADSAGPWSDEWADLIEAADARGILTQEQLARYLRTGVQVGFRARPKILAGDECPVLVSVQAPRMGGRARRTVDLIVVEIAVDGAPVAAMAGRTLARMGVGRGGMSSTSVTLPVDGAPGEHRVRLVLSLRTRGGADPATGNPDAQGARWTKDLEVGFEILPADAPLYSFIDEPSLEDQVHRSLTVSSLSVGPQASSPGRCEIDISVDSREPPVNLAFDLYVRAAGREYYVSSIASLAGQQMGWGGGASDLDELTADRVDVIFRPSLKAMKASLDIDRAWGKEVIIEGVPLKRRGHERDSPR